MAAAMSRIGFVDIEFGNEAHRGLHVGAIVAELDAGLDAVKERGGDGEEAVAARSRRRRNGCGR